MTIEDVLTVAKKYSVELDEARLKDAYLFAKQAHEGYFRKSGEPYIIHPLHATYTLAHFRVDTDALCACLLHDVPEDTEVTLAMIQRQFGNTVAELVDGITKLSKVRFVHNMKERQIESLRKMFLAMAKDIRVVLIKLCDRLHNMQTLDAVEPSKRRRIAQETAEIYVPLADRLGIWRIKSELEDLCFKHIRLVEYELLKRQLSHEQTTLEAFHKKVRSAVVSELKKRKVACKVTSRIKNLFSIYKKMKIKQKSLHEIYDKVALRIITEDVSTCYTVLGVIHEIFNPKVSRFKDYIAVPKLNGYRSLHTTVFAFGHLTEIQIRDVEMHEQAEFGVASHWYYKESQSKSSMPTSESMQWIKNLASLSLEKTDSMAYLEDLKIDFFNDRIFVFSPKGDVIDLPRDASPVDFAYQIHSDLGNHCIGARVNDRMVALDTPLKSGDHVEILTSEKTGRPRRDWLDFVKTNKAGNAIRAELKRENAEVNEETGRHILERHLTIYNKPFSRLSMKDKKRLVDASSKQSLEELYRAIGEGSVAPKKLLNQVFTREQIFGKKKRPQKKKHFVKLKKSEILVGGEKDLMLRLATCCKPKPGKLIIGFVTRGQGVSIHLEDCPSLVGLDSRKFIPAKWMSETMDEERYRIGIELKGCDRIGIVKDVTQIIYAMHLGLYKIDAKTTKDGASTIRLVVEVHSTDELTRLYSRLESIEGVDEIKRYNVR